jgi:hypothetical protein
MPLGKKDFVQGERNKIPTPTMFLKEQLSWGEKD